MVAVGFQYIANCTLLLRYLIVISETDCIIWLFFCGKLYVLFIIIKFIEYMVHFFDVLLTVHLSIFISVINQLDALTFCLTVSLFHASTRSEHNVLIIKRSKLHYTASGIITPTGGRVVHRLRETCRGMK